MEKMLRRKRTILAFVLPAVLIYLFIVLMPIVNTAYHSTFKWNILGAKKFVGLQNFVTLFTKDKIFLKGMLNTFLLMFASLIIQTPLAILLAILVSGITRGKRYFKTVLFLPNILSSVAVGLLWTFIYNPEFGIINRTLEFLGLDSLTRLWLADKNTVLPSIIVTICWQFIGYHMILYLAAVENIPKEIREAAMIDGVNGWTMIRHITLPMILHMIRVDMILMATGSLRFFDLIYVMSNGGPNHASEVIASYMYYKSFRDMQYGYGSAISMVLLVLCLVITLVLNQVLRSEKLEY